MGRIEKLIDKLLDGKNDNNFDFNDLTKILEYYGMIGLNKRGSHLKFTKDGIFELINLQRKKDKNQAKPYQVKQVREFINKYFKK